MQTYLFHWSQNYAVTLWRQQARPLHFHSLVWQLLRCGLRLMGRRNAAVEVSQRLTDGAREKQVSKSDVSFYHTGFVALLMMPPALWILQFCFWLSASNDILRDIKYWWICYSNYNIVNLLKTVLNKHTDLTRMNKWEFHNVKRLAYKMYLRIQAAEMKILLSLAGYKWMNHEKNGEAAIMACRDGHTIQQPDR
jgi:hypothetical protein